ncbi:MAG: pyridoxal phosphate-dependent aminotransferase [Lachnospiraceae bacterium]|nr:pyridoxal phosphate-dependent aminotransferase [Lachnospiraceae bacterium]
MPERNLDFDRVIDRRGTESLKYDFALRRGKPEDVLPLWVADMDFKTSSYVEDAVIERTRHVIFGYTETLDEYFNAVAGWMERHHDWTVKREWLVKTPGVVFALAMGVKAYTEPGDPVLIQQPVYYPFSEVIEDNGRRIISSDLYLGDDNRYHIDFEDFERKIRENDIKLFILCNPHNPTGRVFTLEELTRLGDICVKYGVTVIADEIHNDIILEGRHTVFALVKKEFEDISIICTSPSKTFNLAGMLLSNIFIPNRDLRKKFKKQVDAAGISQLGTLGITAAKAAYEKGDEWYNAMLGYVKENVRYVREYTEKYLKGVELIKSEGTYLLWLDFRKTGISPKELDRRITYVAKLWLDSGEIFGKTGEGFQRINVAAPRAVITECMERLKSIIE